MSRAADSTIVATLAATLLVGCGDDVATSVRADAFVSDADTSCDDIDLSYENFGASFIEAYCLDCHSVIASNRKGAPLGVNFDDFMAVQIRRNQIRTRAGSTTGMPPTSALAFPSSAERGDLVDWIRCGLAE